MGSRFVRRGTLGAALSLLVMAAPAGAQTGPGQSYTVPSDNPFVGQPGAAPEVYAYGLRNPWRFSFDRATGDLSIADVGQSAREEVNFAPRGQDAGANYGWNCFEGTLAYSGCTAPGHVPPVLERSHGAGVCSITGGYVVRDPALAGTSLNGRYVYGDFCDDNIRSAVLAKPSASGDAPTGLMVSGLSSFGEDAGGGVYAVSLNGPVRRIVPDGAGVALSASLGSFSSPTYVTAPPGDGSRLLVVERGGTVRMRLNGATLPDPFLDIRRDVSSGGERGLLSIAFPPDYAQSGLLYAYYTDGGGDIRVDELRRADADPNRVDPAYRRSVLFVEHTARSNHNGGQLQFGPDGVLWVATGDGGGAGDPDRNGQNPGTLLGKILRIDPRPSSGRPYTVPGDNPFVGRRGARGEIWAYGLRNPWRFSFDAATGALWIGDVGQGDREEVSAAAPGSRGGENYGWNRYEGTRRFAGGSAAGLVPPVHDYAKVDGNCAVTGGYVYRGGRIDSLQGRYVFADFCRGEVLTLVPDGDGTAARPLGPQVEALASFGQDADRELYALSLTSGLYRLDPA